MHQVRFRFIERVDAFFEIRTVEIDVGRAGDVERFEFRWSANVKDDEVRFRKQFLGVSGVNVLDRGRTGYVGCGRDKDTKCKNEGKQGAARKRFTRRDHNVEVRFKSWFDSIAIFDVPRLLSTAFENQHLGYD